MSHYATLFTKITFVLLQHIEDCLSRLSLKKYSLSQSKKDSKDQESKQVAHLTQDTISHGKVTKSQLDITNKRISPFPAGDHRAAMNRRKSMTNTRYK